jgi:putative salt-induced outer membrane protein YdiY
MQRNAHTPPQPYFGSFSVTILYCLCALGMLSSSLHAALQVVSLNSGERLVGEILPQSNEQTLVLLSDALGQVSLPRARVVKIEPQPDVEIAQNAVLAPLGEAAARSEAAAVEAAIVEEKRVVDQLMNLKAPDSWKGNLRAGLNLSRGDRKWSETSVGGNLEIKERGSLNFYRINGSYTYRKSENSNVGSYISTDRYDGTFTYRRTFSDDWFLQNSLGGRADEVKGIDREVQELLGVGYKYKPTAKLEFLLGGGGGVEDFQADFEDTRSGINPVLNVFQEFTWHVLKRTSVVQKFNYYWNPEDEDQFNFVFTAALRIRLTDLLGLEFAYSQNFDNDIGTGDNKKDTQWRNAMVVYF